MRVQVALHRRQVGRRKNHGDVTLVHIDLSRWTAWLHDWTHYCALDSIEVYSPTWDGSLLGRWERFPRVGWMQTHAGLVPLS
jgi:hypothetical protein